MRPTLNKGWEAVSPTVKKGWQAVSPTVAMLQKEAAPYTGKFTSQIMQILYGCTDNDMYGSESKDPG